MPLSLRVPALGESVREATIGAWKRAEGDEISADEPLVEVESEKATLEVPSPGAGILRKILRKTGETVAVGDVIAEIDQIGAGAAASPAKSPVPAPASTSAATDGGKSSNGGAPRAAPSARKAMAESGIAPGDVKGSGRGGRISKQDVDRAVEERAVEERTATASHAVETRAPEPVELPAGARAALDVARERVVPMSPLRRTVARRLVEAQQTAAILTTFNEVDMTNVLALRERYQERFVKSHGIKLGFMSFFVRRSSTR